MASQDATELGTVLDTDGGGAICALSREQLIQLRGSAQGAGPAAYSVGGVVKIAVADRWIFATLDDLRTDRDTDGGVIAQVSYLGEGSRGPQGEVVGFQRGLNLYPHPGDPVRFASEADLARIFDPPDLPHIQIGTVYPSSKVRAPVLFDRLMGRHFAIVGSSGAGKSTLVTLMLNRIVRQTPHANIVILDPHGEYASAFGNSAKLWHVGNLQLPYWAMNLENHCEALITSSGDERSVDANIMAKCLLVARKRNLAARDNSRITADSPVAYRLEDLTEAIEQEAGKLEKMADTSRYTRLRLNIEQAFKDPRYRFIFNAAFADTALEQTLGELMRMPGEGMPISIVDLTGVPTEIINVVVSTLSRLILDFSIRAPREGRSPILLVCEEAHRYLPREASEATRSVERQLERIAREGRKYGVCLGMVSQRPSELSDTALSQCGTFISLRLNNILDQEHLRASLPEGARSYVDSIATLKNQECIIAGDGVPVTMRVMIDTLEEDLRPSSDDPLFSERWRAADAGAELIAQTVRRWREEDF